MYRRVRLGRGGWLGYDGLGAEVGGSVSASLGLASARQRYTYALTDKSSSVRRHTLPLLHTHL